MDVNYNRHYDPQLFTSMSSVIDTITMTFTVTEERIKEYQRAFRLDLHLLCSSVMAIVERTNMWGKIQDFPEVLHTIHLNSIDRFSTFFKYLRSISCVFLISKRSTISHRSLRKV